MADDLQDLGTTPEFRQLFSEYQDWKETPRLNVKTNTNLFGFEGTAQQLLNHSPEQPHALQFLVTLENLQQIFDFLTFFVARKGRLEKFWFPLPYNVFTAVGQQVISATKLLVNSPSFDYKGFERVYLLLENGDLITRHVTAVSDAGGGNLFFDVSALDRTIEESDVVLSSLLLLVRFDQDDVELLQKQLYCSSFSVRLLELINEYSEV